MERRLIVVCTMHDRLSAFGEPCEDMPFWEVDIRDSDASSDSLKRP